VTCTPPPTAHSEHAPRTMPKAKRCDVVPEGAPSTKKPKGRTPDTATAARSATTASSSNPSPPADMAPVASSPTSNAAAAAADTSSSSPSSSRKQPEATPVADVWAAFEADLRELNPGLNSGRLADKALTSRVEFNEDGLSFRRINLSGLGLVALPPSVGTLRQRRPQSSSNLGWEDPGGLNLQHNLLTSIPDALADAQIEGELRLNDNRLASLSSTFCERVRVGGNLNLKNNRLASVPASFGSIHVGGTLTVINNPFPKMGVGQRVTILGVKSRPELNGQSAVCRELYLEKRRWRVQLEGTGEEISLKQQSLRAGTFPKVFPNVGGVVFPPHPPLVGPGHFLGRQGEGSNIEVPILPLGFGSGNPFGATK